MVTGDKIKLIKRLGILNNIGSVYEVSRVTDKGFVFKSETTNGYLTLDDFSNYFELVSGSTEEKQKQWTEWEFAYTYELSPFGEYKVFKRNNGHKVQLKTYINEKPISATAACSPVDTFSEKKGMILAGIRLYAKVYEELAQVVQESL